MPNRIADHPWRCWRADNIDRRDAATRRQRCAAAEQVSLVHPRDVVDYSTMQASLFT
jgi:hypothetical protein